MGETVANLYRVALAFPGSSLANISEVYAAGLKMPAHLAAYKGVIGREVLHQWETFYSGLRRRLTIRDHLSLWGWLFS